MNRIRQVTSGRRAIRMGKEYDKYFPKAEARDRVIIRDGEVDDTLQLMEKVVWKYLDDTKAIAQILKRNTTETTCKAIWEFLYHHLQYRLDKKGLEQLRRPARSWMDRTSGVDCDCMSIFASSILTNLQIPHSFRITKYNEDFWQHVYVIVPSAQATQGYYTIDAVVSEFNYEKPFSEKSDFSMSLKGINVAVLSGLSGDAHTDALFNYALSGPILGATSNKAELDQLYKHLVDTRNAIAGNPALIANTDDPQGFLKMLDYAIQYWHTDKREQALAILEQNEKQLNIRNGFGAMDGYILDYDESLDGISIKGFFSSVKKAAKDVGKGVKAAVKAVVRFNPLAISARNGFLLAMKMNVGKMATHLKWGYATKEQALKKGISEAQWNKARDARAKVEKLFVDKLQGKSSSMQNAILKGKAGNLNGVVEYQLEGGEEGGSGSSIAAALPIVKVVLDILKKSGLMGKDEKVDADAIAKEVAADPQSEAALKSIEAEHSASDSSSTADSSDGSSKDKKPGGIMAFIKANPIPTAIGTGLLALGVYQMVKPKEKKAGGLNGVKKQVSEKKSHNAKSGKKKSQKRFEKVRIERMLIQ